MLSHAAHRVRAGARGDERHNKTRDDDNDALPFGRAPSGGAFGRWRRVGAAHYAEEAIRLAQQNSPVTIAARNTINANEATVRTRKSSFLPTLSGSYGGSHSDGASIDGQGRSIPRTGPPWSFNRGISANLNLWDSGERLHNLRVAQANVATAEANE
jgi:outer membrane protein TolC